MDRTVPSTASEEIELYIRTVYSLLRSTTDVQIKTLEEVHAGMNSSMHLDARASTLDTSAFLYALLRLPDCIFQVHFVVLGQSNLVFAQHGYTDLSNWRPVSARARRRRCYFNEKDTLACFIASRSDIDDIIPVLTAYQIEWNKLNYLLQRCPPELISPATLKSAETFSSLAMALEMSGEDLDRLWTVWGDDFIPNLQLIAKRVCSLRVRLLAGSLSEYWRATRSWWDTIEANCSDLLNRPVYFVSSNNHSLANLLSGFALQHKDELVSYLKEEESIELVEEWTDIEAHNAPSNMENFLYYVLKKYQQTTHGQPLIAGQLACEQKNGIQRILSEHSFDLEAQVIELCKLDIHTIDPRLNYKELSFLKHSDAMILNIDYPLGLSAYNILAKVAEHISGIQGIYVMGKSATLNGVRGDVIIPNVVQDEHSLNTYLFQNAFSATDVSPYLVYGTVLDNQKAVSVLGTFLQNPRVMDVIYREGYTDIEMEAGPYLSAIYEMSRPQRHPVNEIVNLYGAPFEIGILHYASDTPLSKGKNLGAGTLSYFGMDSTYATTVAILRKIFERERQRLSSG
ncbi:MAG TPA: hypothetical protein VKF38_14045 [Anaerolineaceae bacterium]|nr:hypothetical protein [Anaerolineaceae bacterium]